jgi:hypothetical protein
MEFLFKDTSFKFETLRAAGFAVDMRVLHQTIFDWLYETLALQQKKQKT